MRALRYMKKLEQKEDKIILDFDSKVIARKVWLDLKKCDDCDIDDISLKNKKVSFSAGFCSSIKSSMVECINRMNELNIEP